MCAKRIFSVLAFTVHRSRTCPAIKQRRDRLRAVIASKKKEKLMSESTKTTSKSNSQKDDDVKPSVSLHSMLGGSNRTKKSPKLAVVSPPHKKAIKEEENETDTIINCKEDSSILGDDGEDSNSGSLTDLSTFTSPNILQPVTASTD